MLAEAFDIADLKACPFGRTQHFSQRSELAIGEYILVNERLFSSRRIGRPNDSGIKKCATGPEQIMRDLEILRQIFHSDMLEHADARGFVESQGKLQAIPIIPNLDEAMVAEVRGGDSPGSLSRLAFADRDAARIGSIPRRSVNGEATPSASYIDEAVTRVKVQLSADEIELVVLRSVESAGSVTEICGGIQKRGTEPRFIELGRKIVVIRGGRCISASRVFPASSQKTDESIAITIQLGEDPRFQFVEVQALPRAI